MSLMALSNNTLSGCCVSFVIGFSYFFRRKPQELSSPASSARVTTRITVNRKETAIEKYPASSDMDGGGVPCRLLHPVHGRCRIGTPENTRAGHDPVATRPNYVAEILQRNAAVDLDGELQAQFLPAHRQSPDLPQRVGDELLGAEAGIHAHHEDVVHD